MTDLATVPLYWEDTFVFESVARVVELLDGERPCLILNETVFYPQGGGQPCDTGSISAASTVFTVTDVRMQDGKGL